MVTWRSSFGSSSSVRFLIPILTFLISIIIFQVLRKGYKHVFIQGIRSTIVYLSVLLSRLVKQYGDQRLASAKGAHVMATSFPPSARLPTAAEGINV